MPSYIHLPDLPSFFSSLSFVRLPSLFVYKLTHLYSLYPFMPYRPPLRSSFPVFPHLCYVFTGAAGLAVAAQGEVTEVSGVIIHLIR